MRHQPNLVALPLYPLGIWGCTVVASVSVTSKLDNEVPDTKHQAKRQPIFHSLENHIF